MSSLHLQSTYCSNVVKHCTAVKRSVRVINLDPAAEVFNYPVESGIVSQDMHTYYSIQWYMMAISSITHLMWFKISTYRTHTAVLYYRVYLCICYFVLWRWDFYDKLFLFCRHTWSYLSRWCNGWPGHQTGSQWWSCLLFGVSVDICTVLYWMCYMYFINSPLLVFWIYGCFIKLLYVFVAKKIVAQNFCKSW